MASKHYLLHSLLATAALATAGSGMMDAQARPTDRGPGLDVSRTLPPLRVPDAPRGTPFTASSIMSVFGNTLGGVGILDGELGTFNLGTVSGDDNSALLVQDSKYGRGAGAESPRRDLRRGAGAPVVASLAPLTQPMRLGGKRVQ